MIRQYMKREIKTRRKKISGIKAIVISLTKVYPLMYIRRAISDPRKFSHASIPKVHNLERVTIQ